VDLINANPHGTKISDRAILSITDDTRTFSRVAVLADDKINSMAAAIWHQWCQPYGNLKTILSNQGKVWTSKLESRINSFMPLEPRINCRSEKETFNPEVRQQWQQSRQETSAEEFAEKWNFLCDLQGPAKSKSGHDRRTSMTSKTSWKMTTISKTTALEFWDERNIFKEGINYKDEPTQKSNRLKRSRDHQNNSWNRKNQNWITSGFS
jgi:hypothetical protein